MKRLSTLIIVMLAMIATSCSGQQQEGTEVLLETTQGNIRILLYDATPGHRDNFIKNVKDGKYDGATFHRVIKNFMVQTGDPDTRPGEKKDTTKAHERIPAEIIWPQYYHKRGMVAAARDSDSVNPDKMSDKYQFYFVTGKKCTEEDMDGYENARIEEKYKAIYDKKVIENKAKLDALRHSRDTYAYNDFDAGLQDDARDEATNNPPIEYDKNMRHDYKFKGGAPWLDKEYTIFGEVIEGMDVINKIEKLKTNDQDAPLQEVRITKASIVE